MKKILFAAAFFAAASLNSFAVNTCAVGSVTIASLATQGSCIIGANDQWVLSNWTVFLASAIGYSGVPTSGDILATIANVGSNGFSVTYSDNSGTPNNFFTQLGPTTVVGQAVDYGNGLWISDNAASAGDSNIVSINNFMTGTFGTANLTNRKLIQNQAAVGLGFATVCTGCAIPTTSTTVTGAFGNSLSINDRAYWDAGGTAQNSTNGFTSYRNTFLAATAVDGIPEPMTFVLMGAGLVGIAALRRRKS